MGKGALTFIPTTGTDTYVSTFAPVPDALATDFFYGVTRNAAPFAAPIHARAAERASDSLLRPGRSAFHMKFWRRPTNPKPARTPWLLYGFHG